MTTIEARTSTPAKRNKSSTSVRGKKPKPVSRASAADTALTEAERARELHTTHITKHDRILTLLSRSEGATVRELMDATGWQQHSIRGFLAATVKKKLGFKLTSSKSDGELRRYRIQVKRGR
jgi:predicted HTH transcriptional regulator